MDMRVRERMKVAFSVAGGQDAFFFLGNKRRGRGGNRILDSWLFSRFCCSRSSSPSSHFCFSSSPSTSPADNGFLPSSAQGGAEREEEDAVCQFFFFFLYCWRRDWRSEQNLSSSPCCQQQQQHQEEELVEFLLPSFPFVCLVSSAHSFGEERPSSLSVTTSGGKKKRLKCYCSYCQDGWHGGVGGKEEREELFGDGVIFHKLHSFYGEETYQESFT